MAVELLSKHVRLSNLPQNTSSTMIANAIKRVDQSINHFEIGPIINASCGIKFNDLGSSMAVKNANNFKIRNRSIEVTYENQNEENEENEENDENNESKSHEHEQTPEPSIADDDDNVMTPELSRIARLREEESKAELEEEADAAVNQSNMLQSDDTTEYCIALDVAGYELLDGKTTTQQNKGYSQSLDKMKDWEIRLSTRSNWNGFVLRSNTNNIGTGYYDPFLCINPEASEPEFEPLRLLLVGVCNLWTSMYPVCRSQMLSRKRANGNSNTNNLIWDYIENNDQLKEMITIMLTHSNDSSPTLFTDLEQILIQLLSIDDRAQLYENLNIPVLPDKSDQSVGLYEYLNNEADLQSPEQNENDNIDNNDETDETDETDENDDESDIEMTN